MLYYILFILHYIYIYVVYYCITYVYIYIYTQSVDMYQKDIDETPDFSEHVFCKAATVDLPHMFPAGSQRVPRRNLSASCSNVGFVACGAWDVTRMLPGWRWLDGITMGLLWDYYGITWITTYTWVMLSMFESPGWCLALPKAMNKSAFRWERCWKYVSSRHYSWPKLSCEPGQL